jgi:amidophosphoribosyltransferase
MSSTFRQTTSSFKDECGVFGIWNHPEASRLTYLGLYALQHRGQESAGIVSLEYRNDEAFHNIHRGLGLVNEVFNETILDQLSGRAAIGHNRYSTTGSNLLANAQPLTAQILGQPFAIGHNGNFVNGNELRRELAEIGSILQGTNDTEAVMHLLARGSSRDLLESLVTVLPRLEGAYSLVMLNGDCMVAARDPLGFRPLVMGSLRNMEGGKSIVFASESCALDLIGATLEREIEPGEIVWVDGDGIHSKRFAKTPDANAAGASTSVKGQRSTAKCVFEHVYFARPDSIVFGESVYESRKRMGALLAQQKKVEADVVVPVPDSGVPSALGYSAESGIPFELGIIRNHYIGRTFIEPRQSIRSFGVKVKLNPQAAVLKGKRVVVIDDSLVRGTTCKKIIQLVRAAGATEVHLRIAAPPTVGPCYYGVDTPRKSELIASHKSTEEIRQFVGADTLEYLATESLFKAVRGESSQFCSACFGGEYPTKIYERSKG